MHIWKSAAKSFLSPSTASQEPQPVRTCEDNLEAKSLEWSWLGKKARKRNGGDSSPAQILLLGSSLLIPCVPQEWYRMSFCGTHRAFSACLSLCPVQQQVWVQTNYLSPLNDPRQPAVTILPMWWSPGEWEEASKLCLLLASEISPSCFWKLRARHLYLSSFETVLMGCYVCKEYEFLWGIQWLLNREGIILSIPQKGFFSLRICFQKAQYIYQLPTDNPPLEYPEAATEYLNEGGTSQTPLSLQGLFRGPFFKIICWSNSLPALASWRGSLISPLISDSTFLRVRDNKMWKNGWFHVWLWLMVWKVQSIYPWPDSSCNLRSQTQS